MRIKSFRNRLRYMVNDLLIRNPLWQMLALVVLSSMIIAIGFVLVDGSVGNGFWWTFTRLLDQGTFIGDDNQEPFIAFVGVLITIGGILVLSLLIGIFSSKITEQLDALKRGRSPVVEKDHIIICGDGDRLYEVARELVKAKQEESKIESLVMFSSKSREDMEELLCQRIGKKLAKQVICRSGVTTDVDSLDLVSFDECAGFIVIGDDDSAVIKTLIAVNSIKDHKKIIGICELRNRAKGRIAEMACPGVHWIPVREIVMRLLVQVGRQPGLSSVYSEILSFDGNEFYIQPYEEIEGLTFGEISSRSIQGVVCGIVSNEKLSLNPPLTRKVLPGDRLLMLAENKNSISFSSTKRSCEKILDVVVDVELKPTRILILSGQSRKFGFMLRLLDEYSDPGSEILVAGCLPEEEGTALLYKKSCSNCKISYLQIERTDPDAVETLNPGNYNTIKVISGKSSVMSDEDADSECLVTLLILRDIKQRLEKSWNATVVSEIRNPRNRRLATTAGIDDFIISNEVCSMIMAQLVVQPELSDLYEEIFDPSGCEIQLRSSFLYKSGDFFSLSSQGLAKKEIVLGWITGTGMASRVYLNPEKSESFPAGSDTRVIVIAER